MLCVCMCVYVCIQKVLPQGPFGRIKLYLELEKRPAGGFWADKIVLSQKSVPQGPFGWIKLYFEPEKRPAGGWQIKFADPSACIKQC